MEKIEGSNGTKPEVEQPPIVSEGEKGLMDELAKLKSTNERLLAQSKENAEKYRGIRDKVEAKEELELKESENWKAVAALKEKAAAELKVKYVALKKDSLRKDLDFTVAGLIDSPLSQGATIEHVISEVLKTGMVEMTEDESSFTNVEEAYAKVKADALFLFNTSKAPMANAVPGSNAPTEKKLSPDELFKKAIGVLNN